MTTCRSTKRQPAPTWPGSLIVTINEPGHVGAGCRFVDRQVVIDAPPTHSDDVLRVLCELVTDSDARTDLRAALGGHTEDLVVAFDPVDAQAWHNGQSPRRSPRILHIDGSITAIYVKRCQMRGGKDLLMKRHIAARRILRIAQHGID